MFKKSEEIYQAIEQLLKDNPPLELSEEWKNYYDEIKKRQNEYLKQIEKEMALISEMLK